MIYLIIDAVNSYMSGPKTTTMEMNTERVLPFPAVTICSYSPLWKSLDDDSTLSNFKKLLKLNEDLEGALAKLSLPRSACSQTSTGSLSADTDSPCTARDPKKKRMDSQQIRTRTLSHRLLNQSQQHHRHHISQDLKKSIDSQQNRTRSQQTTQSQGLLFSKSIIKRWYFSRFRRTNLSNITAYYCRKFNYILNYVSNDIARYPDDATARHLVYVL
ncbi:unnamed protein product [Darwinula stevensoni]|uniref:Uncharacterized protein n=1 Tax=Darwinula stevensoni TaxID=69355 RepID=A0A7R9AHJ4_9CRUS|nr:unnamed protein product [Darwinula stevensoni]CAG0905622.1 unnamed protein product [Darwinula stevensoni]